MIYLLLLAILYLLLLFPLKIRVIRNDNQNDIDLYIVKKWNLQVDIDEAISRLYEKNDYHPSTFTTIYNLAKVYKSRNFIKSVLSVSKIKKITIIFKNNIKDESAKIYFSLFSWVIIGKIRDYILNNFNKVKDEYYMVDDFATSRTMVNLEIIFEVRLIYFILSILKNIKELPKLIKLFKKRRLKNEWTSNIKFINKFNEQH